MVILKQIKGSTLMETLVATVLIVIVFMVSSMILNNLFSNHIKNSTRAIEAHVNELQYLYINKKLELPYYSDFNNWKVSVDTYVERNRVLVGFEARNDSANNIFESVIYADE